MRSFAVFTIVLAGAGTAAAAPGRFEVLDRGDAVEVVASGAIAADGAHVSVVRERVELPLSGTPDIGRAMSDDPTVLLAEIRGHARVLSIKLRFDHDQVVGLSSHVSFVQVGDQVHVTIPRQLVAEPPAPAATAPIADAVPASDSVPAPAPVPAPASAPVPASASAPAAAPASAAAPAPASPAAIPHASHARPTFLRYIILIAGLGFIACGVAVLRRRRKTPQLPTDEIEVIASRSLGGKARIVWLGAGERELVIAISPQGVRPIGQWKRGERTVNRSFASSLDDAAATATSAPADDDRVSLPRTRTSDAVSGILRLRGRTQPGEMSAIADEDEQWAKDLVAATGGRR